jgi:hypothetical protein
MLSRESKRSPRMVPAEAISTSKRNFKSFIGFLIFDSRFVLAELCGKQSESLMGSMIISGSYIDIQHSSKNLTSRSNRSETTMLQADPSFFKSYMNFVYLLNTRSWTFYLALTVYSGVFTLFSKPTRHLSP